MEASPKESAFVLARSTPEPSDTSATLMIDFGQSAVARMAAAIGELSGRELADELSHLVVNDLSLVPQGRLRPASAVIRSGQGGVVDHAVVLAALLRARKFPARVVFGLSRDRDPDLAGDDRVIMTLAAWVVVSIDGQWVAIDPMTAQFNRADQLCLSRPGPDVDLQESLSSVFEQLAKIQIEIRGATYAASSSGQER